MTRFRRTKDELARGLSPEQAMKERQAGIENPVPPNSPTGAVKISKKSKKGEIVLRIRPVKGVDVDYFEHLDGREILVEQDEHFYKWLDHHLSIKYADKGREKLFLDILDQGIGGLIGK